MTNFHYLIRKDKCRRDKTWNVLICFSHNSERRYIATTMYVTKKQLNDKFEIKDRWKSHTNLTHPVKVF